ncbi:hypothetical protein [Mycolicibacterium sp.]|uniref:hypothetical protein n=1 Tax=Mycolicibacterium sp. TaxID=2320850 RepID=UPI00355F0BF6
MVRYHYKGGSFSPARLVEHLIAAGEAAPGARGMDVEDVIDQIAGANGIDRATADSTEIPVRQVS